MRKLLVLAVAFSIGILSAAIAAEKDKRQQISFNVYGVVCPGCARVLTSAFQKGKVVSTGGFLRPNKGQGPVRISATIAAEADLGKVAKAINTANTPHKSESPPGLSVVLFAKLDKESAKKAVGALGKVEGVDAKRSTTDAKKGEISVRISGEKKVTLAGILDALRDAKIDANASKASSKKLKSKATKKKAE